MANPPVNGESTTVGVPGVIGKNTATAGVSRGVEGWSTVSEGVVGISQGGNAVFGISNSAIGVLGESNNSEGVRGVSHHIAHSAVVGINDWKPAAQSRFIPGSHGAPGGWFESAQGEGVRGTAHTSDHGGVVGFNTAGGAAVYGTSDNGAGVWGTSINNEGVHAETRALKVSALAAWQLNKDSESAALYASHAGKRTAAFFDGDIIVTGAIHMNRADYAEEFTVTNPETACPGMVMVLDDSGNVSVSQEAYDTRVAGVVSGAGSYKPAVILDHDTSLTDRRPLALMGKAYCLVDATEAPVGIGDLLTTSPVPGHAMKALDPLRAFGSVIGKALQPLVGGRGLIPILVRLQ